jgi:hypothetical protein
VYQVSKGLQQQRHADQYQALFPIFQHGVARAADKQDGADETNYYHYQPAIRPGQLAH